MKKNYLNIALTVMIITCFFINSAISQTNVTIDKKEFNITNSKDGYKDAYTAVKTGDSYFEQDNRAAYRMALPEYLKAYNYNKNSAELNYKTGICYLNSNEKSKAITFLRSAYTSKPQMTKDIKYFMGAALQYSEEFDEALKFFEEFKKENPTTDLSVDKKINECNVAKELVKNPMRVFVDNVGSNINSKYPDYNPVITTDESMMIFTSRRDDTTGKEQIDPSDGMYYEDLYISYSTDKKNWSPARNMKELNTAEHDAPVCLSPDGQTLYTYKGKDNGTILESKLNGDTWTKPKELGKNINTKYIEKSASISHDGRWLYFVSNRPVDGFNNKSIGGLDIFVSERQFDGSWGPAKNLGEPINTKYDEDGVFMHPDGVTIYFSSKREGSMGGYDIFYSEMDINGKWIEPVNMGYPINTPDDDIYFVVAGNARYAYYSSTRDGGQGASDIYRITMLGAEKLFATATEDMLIASSNTTIQQKVEQEVVEVRKVRLTIMKGTVTDAISNEAIEASIEIVDNEKNELINTIYSNKATGKYIASLPSGKNYGIAVKADGYLFHSENVDIPQATSYQEIEKDIQLHKIEVGSKIVLKNIFFDFDKATLRSTSVAELNRLMILLEAYPKMKIELGGHTDNKGSLKYNTDLSEARAKAVVDYLVEHGINQDRLTYKGYAYLQPIATNDTDEGRQENRRVEFKIASID